MTLSAVVTLFPAALPKAVLALPVMLPLERLVTHVRVKAAAGVAEERIKTIGRVVAVGDIMQERVHTGGSVA
jgi:hypothetical protein